MTRRRSKKPFYVYFRILHAYTIIYLKYKVCCSPSLFPISGGSIHMTVVTGMVYSHGHLHTSLPRPGR